MDEDGFDFKELDDFSLQMIEVANDTMPKESKKFLRKEGTKLRKITAKKARKKVKKDTGRYFKSIKRGKVYDYEDSLAIRAYSTDNKAHLLEKGHREVTHDGEEVGWVDGFHIFEESGKEFQDEYFDDNEEFVEEIVKALLVKKLGG